MSKEIIRHDSVAEKKYLSQPLRVGYRKTTPAFDKFLTKLLRAIHMSCSHFSSIEGYLLSI